jgi:hypothetical protein
MDLYREQQQEVKEISSEEEEKKTETSLSSNEIRQEAKASGSLLQSHKKENESTDSSDSVSDNESRPSQ